MKEEEKISIEMLKSITFIDYQWYTDYKGEAINDTTMNKVIETVLKLIETQKAEIDAKRFDIETLKEELENDINKIDKLQVELEKRDREINRLKDELGYTRKVVEGEERYNAQKKEI